MEIIKEMVQASDPSFMFSAAQLNINTRTRAHIDAHNLGPSKIIMLGPFVGGWYWQDNQQGTNVDCGNI